MKKGNNSKMGKQIYFKIQVLLTDVVIIPRWAIQAPESL
jgi:hypothetical protein